MCRYPLVSFAYWAGKSGQDVLQLARPGRGHRIVSIYRGGGLRLFSGEQPRSFDGFLLAQAVSRGAKHVPHCVQTVKWIKKRPLLYVAGEQIPANLLVLATGVNSRPPLADSFGYTPPPTGAWLRMRFCFRLTGRPIRYVPIWRPEIFGGYQRETTRKDCVKQDDSQSDPIRNIKLSRNLYECPLKFAPVFSDLHNKVN